METNLLSSWMRWGGREILGLILILLPFTGFAVDLEDFTGGVTGTRISNNPASIGLVGNNYLQFIPIGFRRPPINPTYVEQLRFAGQEVSVLLTDSSGALQEVSDIKGLEGQGGKSQYGYVAGFKYFSLGFGVTYQEENYENGTYVDDSGVPLVEGGNHVENTSYRTFATSEFYLAIPLENIILGIKYSTWELESSQDDLLLAQVVNKADNSILYAANLLVSTTAESRYFTTDYGILIPDLLGFSFGFVYRPEVEATMDLSLNNNPNLIMEDFEFTVPAYTSVGFGYTLASEGNFGLQFLGDLGQTSETTKSISGAGSSVANQSGGVARFLLLPWIDVSYGTQTQDVFPFTIERTTTTIQFPSFSDSNLRLGIQNYKLTNSNGEEIVAVTLLKISFNMQFGEGSGSTSCRTVKPKQKELTAIDRLGAC